MNTIGLLAQVGANLFVSSPLLLVWLVGLGLAVARWRQEPRAAPLVVFAIGLELLGTLAGTLLSATLPTVFLRGGGGGATRLGGASVAIGLVRALLSAAAWGLMIAAVFVSRRDGRGDVADGRREDGAG